MEVFGKEIENNEGKMGVAVIKLSSSNDTIDELTTIQSIANSISNDVHPAGKPRVYRIVDSIAMTDTFKYKKVQISKEDITENDYFCDKNDTVQKLNSELLENLVSGKLNAII